MLKLILLIVITEIYWKAHFITLITIIFIGENLKYFRSNAYTFNIYLKVLVVNLISTCSCVPLNFRFSQLRAILKEHYWLKNLVSFIRKTMTTL